MPRQNVSSVRFRVQPLVLFGSEDKMVAPEAARIYRERIPNSNIAFVYDAGHLIEGRSDQEPSSAGV